MPGIRDDVLSVTDPSVLVISGICTSLPRPSKIRIVSWSSNAVIVSVFDAGFGYDENF